MDDQQNLCPRWTGLTAKTQSTQQAGTCDLQHNMTGGRRICKWSIAMTAMTELTWWHIMDISASAAD